MELKLFEYILTIAEEKNIARAADKLYLSRSALNRQLLNLEQRLHVPLFKRLNNSLMLTYAGEIYVDMAKQVLDIEKQTAKQLNDIAKSNSGRINLGINQGRAFQDFSRFFQRFHQKYPGVNVSLTGGWRDELEEMVLSGQLDIALVASGEKHPGLEYRMTNREEVVLAVPIGHPMAHLASSAKKNEYTQMEITWFKDDYFALMNHGTRIRDITDILFQREAFEPKVLLEDSFVSVAYNMVKSGACCTILSEIYIDKDDPIVCFSLTPRQYLELALVYRKTSYLSEAEQHLMAIIEDYYIA